jgi:hypothetical protein
MKRFSQFFSTNGFKMLALNLIGMTVTGYFVAQFHNEWAWLAWALISLYVSFWSFMTAFATFCGLLAIRKVRKEIKQVLFLQRVFKRKVRNGIKFTMSTDGPVQIETAIEACKEQKKKLYAYIEWINKSLKGFNA